MAAELRKGERVGWFVDDFTQWKANLDALLCEEKEEEAEECTPEGRLLFMHALRTSKSPPLVRVHSLNTTEMNGKEGELLSYSSSRDRFFVCVSDSASGAAQLAVKAKNLELIAATSCFSTDDENTSTATNALLNSLLCPGARFRGTIQIPNDGGFENANGSRQDYTLTIIETEVEDELGRPATLARHRAYGDEQYVFINVNGSTIEYSDGETHCRGEWVAPSPSLSTKYGRFQGSVFQLIQGEANDNCFHKTDTATHTFTLEFDGGLSSAALFYPDDSLLSASSDSSSRGRRGDGSNGGCGSSSGSSSVPEWIENAAERSRAYGSNDACRGDGSHSDVGCVCRLEHKDRFLTSQRAFVEQLAQRLVGQFQALFDAHAGDINRWVNERCGDRSASSLSLSPEFEAKGAKFDWHTIPWRALLRFASLRAELLCARFRQRSAILDSLRFKDKEDRVAVLNELENISKRAAESEALHVEEHHPLFMKKATGSSGSMCYTGVTKEENQQSLDEHRDLANNKIPVDCRDSLSPCVESEKNAASLRPTVEKGREVGDARGGISLASAHREWDAIFAMGRSIAQAWSLLNQGFSNSMVMTTLELIQIRLDVNFRRLEYSFQRAASRLTQQTINSWKCPPMRRPVNSSSLSSSTSPSSSNTASLESSPAEDRVCPICYISIGDIDGHLHEDDQPLFLPCNHTFHSGCIRTWLFDHSQCPMCRCGLSEDSSSGNLSTTESAAGSVRK